MERRNSTFEGEGDTMEVVGIQICACLLTEQLGTFHFLHAVE